LPKTVESLWYNEDNKAFKAHIHYEILKSVPVSAQITNGNVNEKQILEQNLQPGRLYVLDRGFCKYELLQQIVESDSSFVCRIKDDAHIQTVESRELSQEDIASGIISDCTVKLGRGSNVNIFQQPIRVVKLKCTERTGWDRDSRNTKRVPNDDEIMLIATNRTDLSADVIAVIYKHRWQVEIFFRFFKHILGCRHLLSYCDNGVAIEIYVGIIACLLIALYTGRKPTKRTYEMFCWYLSGWADEDELLEHIEALQKQN